MSTPPRQSAPLFSPEPEKRGHSRGRLWPFAIIAVCALALAFQVWHFSLSLPPALLRSVHPGDGSVPGGSAAGATAGPLWVLLMRALRAMGASWPASARLLSLGGTLAGAAAVGAEAYRDYPAKVRGMAALLACLALSLSGPVGLGAATGIGQTLLGGLLAWAAYFCIRWVSSSRGRGRDADAAGLLLALALLAQPDALLFPLIFYCGAVAADGFGSRAVLTRLRVLALPAVAAALQWLLRHLHRLPALSSPHRGIGMGLRYDLSAAGADVPFLILAVAGAMALWVAGRRRQVIWLTTVCAGWSLVVLVTGGDGQAGWPALIPALMLGGFLVAGCGLLTLAAPFRFSAARVAIFLVLTALVLSSDLFIHAVRPLPVPAMQGETTMPGSARR